MGISTFSQYQDSIINDLNRFGEFDQIINTLTEISNFGGISELARIREESTSHLAEMMQSMLSNSGMVAALADAHRLKEEFGNLRDQMVNAVTEISNLGGISELTRIREESTSHLAEMMQSMLSNSGMVAVLADAHRFRNAVLRTLSEKLSSQSETSQGLLDWLSLANIEDYEEESTTAGDGINNVSKLAPESEKILVSLICVYLIFLITAISLHNRGETLEATELAKLALNILPIIYPLLRFKQH